MCDTTRYIAYRLQGTMNAIIEKLQLIKYLGVERLGDRGVD